MTCRAVGRSPGPRLGRLRGALPVIVLVVLASWTALASPTPAAAGVRAADGSGAATIRGALLVPGGAIPPAGVTVTLLGVPASGDSITRTAISGPGGTFEFTGLAGGSTWSYTLTAPYRGTVFSSDVVGVDEAGSASANVAVFETTASTQDVRVSDWTVWVDVDDGGMAVQQDLTLVNTGTAAYLGTEPVAGVPGNDRASVTLPLLAGAATLKYLGRFEVCCGAVADGSWSHNRPLDPGESTGTLRYEAPMSTQLSFPVRFATAGFSLLVPDGSRVESAQLTEQPSTRSDRGVTYRVYRSGPLPAGSTVSIGFTPPSTENGSWWIVVGAAAVILGLLVVLVVRRRAPAATPAVAGPSRSAVATRSARPPKRPASAEGRPAAPRARPAAGPPRSQPGPGARPASVARSADVLADELAMLDLAFERGALPDEAAYRRVRESLVQRLVAEVGEDPASLGS